MRDGDGECKLPSLVSLGSLGSFGLSVGDVSKFNATMTTVCAVAEAAMRCASNAQARRERCLMRNAESSSDDNVPEGLLMVGPLFVAGEDVLLRSTAI